MAPKKDTPAQRDECVNYAIELLMQNIDQHLKDKFIFPHIVSHAVARTVAGMVHMVSIGIVNRLENWDSHVERRVAEEWHAPKEPVLPPLDTWARGVVPVKQKPAPPAPPPPVSCELASEKEQQKQEQQQKEQQQQQQLEQQIQARAVSPASTAATSVRSRSKLPTSPGAKPTPSMTRRATLTFSPGSPIVPLEKPSAVYDRKGSPVRRFSEGVVLPPEMVKKFQSTIRPEDATSVSSTRSSIRKSMLAEGRKSLTLNVRRSLKPGDSPASPTLKGGGKTTPTGRRASMK